MNRKEQEQPEAVDDEKKYVYAIVAIILITGMVVVLMNNGRVTDVENLDARVAKVYDNAPTNAIQKIFENKEKSQYADGSGEYDAER